MVQLIKAAVNHARFEAGYTAQQAAYDFEWDGDSRSVAVRRANRLYYREVFKLLLVNIWISLKYTIFHPICDHFGHSKHVEIREHINGDWNEVRQQWDDIDGASVEWFCPRCGRGGRSYW